jgi:hypothetical protein
VPPSQPNAASTPDKPQPKPVTQNRVAPSSNVNVSTTNIQTSWDGLTDKELKTFNYLMEKVGAPNSLLYPPSEEVVDVTPSTRKKDGQEQ